MVRSTLDAVARAFIAICVLLLFGYLHLTSVYYAGSPRVPDASHGVPVAYKGVVIYVTSQQQDMITYALIAGLCAGGVAVVLWLVEWSIGRRRRAVVSRRGSL